MTRILSIAAFVLGLAVVGWVGAGYIGSNPLALAVTATIAVVFLGACLELRRYHVATGTLSRALAGLSAPPATLAGWLDTLHPALRGPVRLRVEGDRVALPGPALTPYLVGLLVLLGMLGTFLGMVATLRGTGIALESATDLQAIRASLAAPVKGLGFAFGTSVAGVAASAALGLLSALCRRERILAGQRLDMGIATVLREHTAAHRRDETFRLLQRQAEAMPVLVDRLQTMMAGMEQRNQSLNEQLANGMSAMERQHAAMGERLATGQAALDQRLASGQDALNARLGAGQEAFHEKTEAAYARLAASVEHTLKESAAEGARLAGAALQPVVEATMAGLARETAALRDSVAQAVRQQHESIEQAVQRQHASFTQAVERQHASITEAVERQHASISEAVERQHASITQAVERQHDAITEAARQQHDTVAQATLAQRETIAEALQRQQDTVADAVRQQLDGVSTRFETTAAALEQLWNQALSQHRQTNAALAEDLRGTLDRYAGTFEQRSASLVAAVSGRLDAVTADMSRAWTDALALQQEAGGELATRNQQALTAAAAAFEQHSAALLAQLLGSFEQQSVALLQAVEQTHDKQRLALEARDRERLDAWTGTLSSIAGDMRTQWRETGDQTTARQQEICDTLSRTAREITEHTQSHARDTIAEIERLVQAAAEAPRAAADVVAELRQKLSDSMVRDNAMLEERSRLLETLGTLLDAVNRASTEQREAVEALVGTSADLLARVGGQFTDTLEAETAKLAEAASLVSGSVVEVASMGDAFGAAVQAYGQSNEKLMEHLQRIEGALEKSIARSDEQLAYYVAQAREAIDLSVMSQKQIIEELQQFAEQRTSAGSEAA
ncbi:hypothetical protein CAL12_13145 [Bordetella genomosp. 8]|uniref:DUF802 domain-containing protein n=1 Tax=Bordetella genomosp. 8 TaxID=1416806 RepID=A0A1W6YM89_9BORD|nr:DUF802 domain-containing protein [Bordetella genomosp. 8]ARP81663.1 hypothetical protein CAL12_13145 [Bordetella genomosp. 8]